MDIVTSLVHVPTSVLVNNKELLILGMGNIFISLIYECQYTKMRNQMVDRSSAL